MVMLTKLSVIVLVNLEISLSIANYTGPSWNYDDESNWPGALCHEGGFRQSPIEIKTKTVLKDFKKRFIKYNELQFMAYEKVLLDGVNNGHTIQFSTAGDESIHPWITGGPLKHKYRLEQLHFHWLSEHAIDGKKFPMEIHLVHVRSDLKVPEALSRRDGLAIVSVMCNTVFELNEEEEDKVIELMGYVPMMMKTGDRVSGVLLDLRGSHYLAHQTAGQFVDGISARYLNKLIPNTDSYFTYAGSLTSPQCNEVVIWIIFDTPLVITKRQYNQIKKAGFGRENFRTLRPIKRHVVYRPPPVKIWNTPYLVGMVKDVYSSVAGFFKDVSRYFDKENKDKDKETREH